MTTYTNPAHEAAINAATDQTAQCTTAVGFFAGNVTRKIYAADGTTHLATLTHGPFTVGGVTQKRLVAGAKLAQTHIAAGVAAYIAECDGATERFRGPVALTYPVTEGWPIDLTDHPAWVANPALPLAPPAPSAVDVSGFSAASIAFTPVGGSLQTLTPSPANRLADIPADAIFPAHAVWRIATSDPNLFVAVMYCPAHLDGAAWSCAGVIYERTDVGTLGSTISTKTPGALKEYDFAFTWASGQTDSYQARVAPTGVQARGHFEGQCSYVPSRVLPWRSNWRTFVQKSGVNGILPPAAVAPQQFVASSPITNATATRFACKFGPNDTGTSGERPILGIISEPTAWLMARNGTNSNTSAAGLTYLDWSNGCAKDMAEWVHIPSHPGKLRPISVYDAAYQDMVCVLATGGFWSEDRAYHVGDWSYQYAGLDMRRVDTQHMPAGLAEVALLTGDQWFRWQQQRQSATHLAVCPGGASWLFNGRRRSISSNAGRDSAWALRSFAFSKMLAPTADNDVLMGAAHWNTVVSDHLDYGAAVQAQTFNFHKAPFYGSQDATVDPKRDRSMLGRAYWSQVLAWLMNCTDATIRTKAAAVAQPLVEQWYLYPAGVDLPATMCAASEFKTTGGTAYTSADWATAFDDHMTRTDPTQQFTAGDVTDWGAPYTGLTAQLPTWVAAPAAIQYHYCMHTLSACQMFSNVTTTGWTANSVTMAAFIAQMASERSRLGGYMMARYNMGDGSNIV